MQAVTHYRVICEKTTPEGPAALVECILETGRTHQIRVHMSAAGHPLFGDRIYGIPDKAKRLYLHAESVSLYHPFTGEPISVCAVGEGMDNSVSPDKSRPPVKGPIR